MKKKYISIILAALMTVTPLQAAASADYTEVLDSATFLEGSVRENDTAFSESVQSASEEQARSEDLPALDEQAESEELSNSEGQTAFFEQADFAAQSEDHSSSQDSFNADYFDPHYYESGYYESDFYGSDYYESGYYGPDYFDTGYFGSSDSGEDDGPAGAEVQFSDDPAWTTEFTENTWQAENIGPQTVISDLDMAVGIVESEGEKNSDDVNEGRESEASKSSVGENEGGESEASKSSVGENEDGERENGIIAIGKSVDTDAPDELLTNEKKDSFETQHTDGFPQSGKYGSFTWIVEEIRTEEAAEDNSESIGNKPSETTIGITDSGSIIPLKLTIEGSGVLLFSDSEGDSQIGFPESAGDSSVAFPESERDPSVALPESERDPSVGFPESAGDSSVGFPESERDPSIGFPESSGTGEGTDSETEIDEATGFPWDSWKERITQISLGEGVTGIGDGAFAGYVELESIQIPESVSDVTSIASDAFDGSAQGFTIYGVFDSFAETYASEHGHPFIGTINGKLGEYLEWELTGERDRLALTVNGSGSMTGIISWPWEEYRNSIIAVKIGDQVTDIGESAFENCIHLAEVELGDSVQEIGRQAFMDCSQLKRLEFPEMLQGIGVAAFSRCVSLEELDFSKAEVLRSIESSAFSDCSSLSSVKLPDSVSILGSYAFYRCNGLTDITLPAGISAIEKKTFSDCSQLLEIIIPANVETIGEEAFSRCTSMKNVSAEGSRLQKIQTGAFMGCTKLESVSVPSCLIEIGASAFELCGSLKMISLPDGMSTVESRVFYNCRNLASVSLPESVISIGDWAFYNCSSLSELILPKRLRSIGRWAFAGCWGIKELNIPDSVEKLDNFAFLDCRNLRVIETTRNLVIYGTYVFVGCDDHCVMYGVRGSVADQYAKQNDLTFIDRRYDLSNAVVTGIETTVWKKNGATQNPKVVLNGKVLKMGTDYTLSYRNNRDVGRAQVRINSAGDYDGSCSRYFNINPKQVTGLKLTAGSKEFKASWKEEEGETLNGYELQYSTSASFKNAVTLTIGKASTPWKRVTKLKAGTTYYVRVRAFRKKGSNIYRSKWSTTQKVKTLK